jgi:hypothetical protein
MRVLRCLLTLFMAGTLFLTACAGPLEKNQRLWQSQGTSGYRYQLQVFCFCPTEITSAVVIEVHGGVASRMYYVWDGSAVTNDFFDRFDTIDKLFEVLKDAYNRKAYEVLVEYDTTRGFPVRVSIDYIKEAVDEELAFTVSEFLTLN